MIKFVQEIPRSLQNIFLPLHNHQIFFFFWGVPPKLYPGSYLYLNHALISIVKQQNKEKIVGEFCALCVPACLHTTHAHLQQCLLQQRTHLEQSLTQRKLELWPLLLPRIQLYCFPTIFVAPQWVRLVAAKIYTALESSMMGWNN